MKRILLVFVFICLYYFNTYAENIKVPVYNAFSQGFESNTDGWITFISPSNNYGTITQVPSGTDGIISKSGSYHAKVGHNASGPFTRFDKYRSNWPDGGWKAKLDIYLDPSWATSSGFDLSVATCNQAGNHLRDFIFHVCKDQSTGNLLVGGSNNTNFTVRQDLENINNYNITTAGWYAFEFVFRNQSGQLAVDLNLRNSSNTLLWTETRTNASDLIASVVGGNRYMWFTFISVPGNLHIDNTELIIYHNTIQSAVNSAVSGDVVIVDDGTYNENININKSLTVKGKNPPTNTALITGKVVISADNVTLENFKIDPPDFTPTYDAAVYVQASNVIIKNNIITDVDGPADQTIKGIHIYKGSSPEISNILVINNKFIDINNGTSGATGVFLQGFVNGVKIMNNTFDDIIGQWAYGVQIAPTGISTSNQPYNIDVMYNLFNKINNSTSNGIAIGVDYASYNSIPIIPDPSTYHFNYNKFNGKTNVQYGVTNVNQTKNVDAKYNWWSDCKGPGYFVYTSSDPPINCTNGETGSNGVLVGCFVDYKPWIGAMTTDMALWLMGSLLPIDYNNDDPVPTWKDYANCGTGLDATAPDSKRTPILENPSIFTEPAVDFARLAEYGTSDILTIPQNGLITSGEEDKWKPQNTEKTLFVVFKPKSGGASQYYSIDGKQCIFEAGGPLSGYNIYIQNGKLVFGMWNRSMRKYLMYDPPNSEYSIYPLNSTYYIAKLEYDGTDFRGTLFPISGGYLPTTSIPLSFTGLTKDGSDKTAIGGAARTAYHNYNTGESYSDSYNGTIGDVMLFNKVLSQEGKALLYGYFNYRYGFSLNYLTYPKVAQEDWKVIQINNFDEDRFISSAYPNPFDTKTSIGINLISEQNINVELLDVMGRKVAMVFNGKLAAGIHDIEIDGTGLSNGIYFIKVAGETFTQTTQVILNK